MNTNRVKFQVGILFIAGALLILVSSLILTTPSAFYAANGIEPGDNLSLLNELKAPAGLLLCAGLFMIGAIFSRELSDTATALAALIYLSYAFTRGLSMVVDGVPAVGLIQAAALEALIGLACLAIFVTRARPVPGTAIQDNSSPG